MKKRTSGVDAAAIVSAVFGFMGIIFFLVGGIVSYTFIASGDVDTFLIIPLTFMVFGIIFTIIGAIALRAKLRKDKKINELIANGQYVMAEVVGTSRDYTVEVNGVHPWRVECEYEDPYGHVHHFQSKNITHDPSYELNPQVRVYVDSYNYSLYYVDVDYEIEPEKYA